MVQTTMTPSNKKDANKDFRERLEYLKMSVDPLYLMESLGFNISSKNNHEIRAACKIHGGDNSTSFRFNKKNLTWTCFTQKCQDIHGYDVIALIKAARGCDFKDAYEYLANLAGGIDGYKEKLQAFKRKQEREELDELLGDAVRDSIVTEDCLRQFKYFRSSRFLKDGFSKETLDYFEIAGGFTDKEGYIRDIIPIRDLNGDLVAYSLRDIRDDVSDNDKKYKLTYGFDKDKVLYNLNNVLELNIVKPLIIVEGFKSVWRLREYGITNVVAVMGSAITPGQIGLLKMFAPYGCVLLFDNDLAGVKATINGAQALNPFMKTYPMFITEVDKKGKGLDPSDLTKQQTMEYLEGFIHGR